MDNIVYNEPKKVTFKTPIFILTLIAIVCNVILVFPNTGFFSIYSLVYMVLSFVPYVLLLLVSIKQTKKIKPATLLCLALLINTGFNSTCGTNLYFLRNYHEITLSSIVTFLFVIVLSLVCVGILRGVKKKAFTITLTAAMIAYELFFLLSKHYIYSKELYRVADIVGLVAFYAAIILFVSKNDVAPANCIKNTDVDLSRAKTTKRIISIVPIIALALAVGAQILGSIHVYEDYDWYWDEFVKEYSLYIDFVPMIGMISLAIFILFFAIFLCGLYKKIKANIAIPIVLGGLSTSYICIALDDMFYFGYSQMTYGLFFAVFFIFAAIMNLKKSLNPSSVLLALCAILPEKLDNLPSIFNYFSPILAGSDFPFMYIAQTIDSLAWILLAFTLVAYMANHHLFEYEAKPLSPQKQLLALKNKFELGTITQEEYQAKRAEIINNL